MTDSKVTLLNNPYGKAAFGIIRTENNAYADKTEFIKLLDNDSMTPYPVLLRPRRFGKSTFVQMLKCFYDIALKKQYRKLFSGTAVYAAKLPSHNSYHVINFDFSGIFNTNEAALVRSFNLVINNGILDFKTRYPDFVFDPDDKLKETPADFFKSFVAAYLQYPKKKSLYVMIDEYDNFANEILSRDLKLFKAITSSGGFLKSFYAAIKAATADTDVNAKAACVAKTFITGVSSVSLDSLTSGFNISRNITSYAIFNDYAGFTEDELRDLIPKLVDINELGVSTDEIITGMKPVYDGYCFNRNAGNTVYNSSMCLYYLDEMRQQGCILDPGNYPDPASDQDGTKLLQLFDIAEKGLTDNIISSYLKNESFFLTKLAESINLNKTEKYSRDQLLSMMYYLGYLTVDPEKSTPDRLILRIPNRFMARLFNECTVKLRFNTSHVYTDPELDVSALLNAEYDISSFSDSCTEFLTGISACQVLPQLNEMSVNLVLSAKLKTIAGIYVEFQKPLHISGECEKFADLAVTVNAAKDNECVYLFELKYRTKKESREEEKKKPRTDPEKSLESIKKQAAKQVLLYRSASEFRDKEVKAYIMIFEGPKCVCCELQK